MPSWKTTKKAYARFCRAADRADLRQICSLIRRYPEIHLYDGPNFALTYILHTNCPEHLEAALAAGLDPNAGAGGVLGTLLIGASSDGDIPLMELLLGYGADTEARNDEGETPLGYAVGWEQREAVELLLDAGAQINAIEDNGAGVRATALDSTQNPELIAYLRSRGAKTLAELEELA